MSSTPITRAAPARDRSARAAVRVGVIGAGFAGTTHARSLTDLPGARLVAVAAETPEEAAPLARELGVRVAADAMTLCAADDVDLVVVASPTDLHAAHTIAAARAGKHVFCEKPLARDAAQAEAMLDACAKAGVALAVGHVVRHFPEYVRARELIQSGAIGAPALATLTRGSFPVGNATPWYRDPVRSGGVVLDLMLHDLDTLRWWFGEPTRVYVRALGLDARGADYALATVRFDGELIAHLEASWVEHAGFRTSFELCGDRGMVVHDSRRETPLRIQSTTGPGGLAVMPMVTAHESPYRIQLRDLLARLERGDAPLVDGVEAYRSLSLAFAAVSSAQRGAPVSWTRPL
jgi:predicted dehydrogenase